MRGHHCRLAARAVPETHERQFLLLDLPATQSWVSSARGSLIARSWLLSLLARFATGGRTEMYFHLIENPKPVQSEAERIENQNSRSRFHRRAGLFPTLRGAAADGKSSPDRPSIQHRLNSTPGTRARFCVIWAMSRGKISPLSIEQRKATGSVPPIFAAELVRLKVDLIVADGSGHRARLPGTATRTIPICQ